MKLNESTAARRRIGPLQALDANGDPVLGATFSGAGEKQISIAGGAFVDALGTIGEIGDGFYYYEGTLPDASTQPWVTVKLDIVCQKTTQRESVTPNYEGAIKASEPTAGLRRIGPIPVLDNDGAELASTAGITVQVSINGAAWAAGGGTLTLTAAGHVYYEATPAEVASVGWTAVRLTGACQEAVVREQISDGGGGFSAPGLTVLTAFAADFRTARQQQWSAQLAGFPSDGQLVVLVHDAERNETMVARDYDGTWRWPFDVEGPDNNTADLLASPATLKLLPRGGWPPSEVEIQVGAAKKATGG